MPVESGTADEAGHKIGDVCLTYIDDSIYFEITKLASDRYELGWSDQVANEWFEELPSLPMAVVRMAAILQCGEHSWDRGTVDLEEFMPAATKLLDFATSGWETHKNQTTIHTGETLLPIDTTASSDLKSAQ